LPKASASPKPTVFQASPEWPSDVIAGAIGVEGSGIIASYHADVKRPTASIAKIITAMAVLEKHPLKSATDLGPSIPLTATDEAFYQAYIAKNGMVVPVKAGTSIRLRHALEAMILPSANNMADTTATWAFGSLDAYHTYATAMLRRMGLTSTIVGGDASGFKPRTQSTARDLFKLGEAALKIPALAAIAAEKEFTLPGIGTYANNRLVTQYNYTGLKPGNTDEAGGTMLFSTKYRHKGKELTLIGVVLGTKSGKTPYGSTLQIVDSTKTTLR
jgi:D-alanyl-D-alanine carboxypeptidase (penicillin-binding protein 5/6)